MQFVVAVPRLSTAVLEGASRLVVGLAELPGALAVRALSAHREVERRESINESKPVRQSPQSQAETVEDLEEILGAIRSRGMPCEVRRIHDGFVVVVLRPELMGKADEIIARALPTSEDRTSIRIEDLGLSDRVMQALTVAGIRSVGDLTTRSPGSLLSTRDVGPATLNEIRAGLNKIGERLLGD